MTQTHVAPVADPEQAGTDLDTSPIPHQEADPQPAAQDHPSRRGRRQAERSRRHPVLVGIRQGLGYGILALTLLLAAIVIVVPKLGGGIPLTILSGSMEPTLPVGSLAVVLPVEPDDVQVGDIVTYLPNPDDPTAITHRVTAIDHHTDGGHTFTMQGDANATADAPVIDRQVRGVVWYAVPLLGYLNSAVNGHDVPWSVYLVAGAFFAWAILLWSRSLRDRKRRARQ